MEVTCEYIEFAAMDDRPGVVLKLEGWREANNQNIKTMCSETSHSLGTRLIILND